MKLKEGQSIVEHMNDFEGMNEQLSVTCLSLDDETQACLLLGPLPNNWNTLVVSLINSPSKGKVTLAMTLWAMTHMPLSRRIGVEEKVEDHLGITSQEVDPSLEGK